MQRSPGKERLSHVSIEGGAEVADNFDGTYTVKHAMEKPENPQSRLAIMGFYAFNLDIIDALRTIPPGRGREIQLTDAIQKLITDGKKVIQALKMGSKDYVLDIGTPETYWQALEFTHLYFVDSATLGRDGWS